MKAKFWENPHTVAFIVLLPVWISLVLIAWLWTGLEKCIDRVVLLIKAKL